MVARVVQLPGCRGPDDAVDERNEAGEQDIFTDAGAQSSEERGDAAGLGPAIA